MDLQPKHAPPTKFIWKYVFSTDHKVIARQFLWVGLFFLFFGGALAMLIRWQWAAPGEPVPLVGNLLFPRAGGAIGPATYNSIFTNHGLTPRMDVTAASIDRPSVALTMDIAWY